MNTIDTLRRAEALLRERAGEATEGPWGAVADRYEGDTCYSVRAARRPIGARTLAITDSDVQGAADATYIALMDPLVGLALADWLGVTADGLARRGVTAHIKPAEAAALTIALRVLGEGA